MRNLINLIESAQAGRLIESAGLIGPVYHGSKRPIVGEFEKRAGKRSAFFTTHTVMANGFFFAFDRHDAEGYGPYVGSYMLRVQRPLLGGELTLSPKQTTDLQYMLEALFRPADEGWLVFQGIQNDYHLQADPAQRDPDWHHEFIHPEPVHQGGSLLAGRLGLDWEVLDHKACADRMRERGYDGTLTYEAAHKTKISWFVLDAAQITPVATDHEAQSGVTESATAAPADLLRLLRGARKTLVGRDDLAWHQTGERAALEIAQNGFKTGEELNTGERCGAIFLTKTKHRDVSYGRGERRTIDLPVVLAGLRLISNDELAAQVELSPGNEAMVAQGIWTPQAAAQYQVSQDMDAGRVPTGFDGIVMMSSDGRYIRKFALTKDAANRGLSASLEALRTAAPR